MTGGVRELVTSLMTRVDSAKLLLDNCSLLKDSGGWFTDVKGAAVVSKMLVKDDDHGVPIALVTTSRVEVGLDSIAEDISDDTAASGVGDVCTIVLTSALLAAATVVGCSTEVENVIPSLELEAWRPEDESAEREVDADTCPSGDVVTGSCGRLVEIADPLEAIGSRAVVLGSWLLMELDGELRSAVDCCSAGVDVEISLDVSAAGVLTTALLVSDTKTSDDRAGKEDRAISVAELRIKLSLAELETASDSLREVSSAGIDIEVDNGGLVIFEEEIVSGVAVGVGSKMGLEALVDISEWPDDSDPSVDEVTTGVI